MKKTYLYVAAGLAVLLLIADVLSGEPDDAAWFFALIALTIVVVLYFRGRQPAQPEQAEAETPESVTTE
jgi:FtsH-binding integral membrane protein